MYFPPQPLFINIYVVKSFSPNASLIHARGTTYNKLSLASRSIHILLCIYLMYMHSKINMFKPIDDGAQGLTSHRYLRWSSCSWFILLIKLLDKFGFHFACVLFLCDFCLCGGASLILLDTVNYIIACPSENSESVSIILNAVKNTKHSAVAMA
jgi:hypothetical protein